VTSNPDDRRDPTKKPSSTAAIEPATSAKDAKKGPAGGGGHYARDDDGVQGEGNYEAAREYDEAQHKFVESGRVDDAARAAAPKTPEEARAMEQAEREGKSHRKS
jgi:hypothetical protein